jgi:hypothetical protein
MDSLPSNSELICKLESAPGVTFLKYQDPVKGTMVRFGGMLLLGVCALASLYLAGLQRNAHSVDLYALLFGTVGLLGVVSLTGVAGAWCVKRGKQLCAVNPLQLLSKDLRRPVVYLRSFLDDGRNDPEWSGVSTHFAAANYMQPTEEETLARVMAKVGPFLAIGKPTEQFPELGAARIYVVNEH